MCKTCIEEDEELWASKEVIVMCWGCLREIHDGEKVKITADKIICSHCDYSEPHTEMAIDSGIVEGIREELLEELRERFLTNPANGFFQFRKNF